MSCSIVLKVYIEPVHLAFAMCVCQYFLHLECAHSQTVHHNAYHEDPYAKEFGIKISEKLASVEARILPAPWVVYLISSILFNYPCRVSDFMVAYDI